MLVERPWPEAAELAAADLGGRVVLVTGASGGLGSAIARRCAAAGATVVLSARRPPPLEALYDALVESGAAQPAIHPLDLVEAGPEQCRALADGIAATCGRLDAVVYAHAHFEALSQFGPARAADYVRALAVNATAPGVLTAALGPLLAASGAGHLLFVLDDPARVGRAYWGGYGVSKRALGALADQLADEWEAGPIHVQGILPPPMRTRLRRAAYVDRPGESLLEPDHIAAAVPALLADAEGRWRNALLRWPPAGEV